MPTHDPRDNGNVAELLIRDGEQWLPPSKAPISNLLARAEAARRNRRRRQIAGLGLLVAVVAPVAWMAAGSLTGTDHSVSVAGDPTHKGATSATSRPADPGGGTVVDVPGVGVHLVGLPQGWERVGGWDTFRKGRQVLGTQSTWWPTDSAAADTSNAFTICVSLQDQPLCDPENHAVAASGDLDNGYHFVVAVSPRKPRIDNPADLEKWSKVTANSSGTPAG